MAISYERLIFFFSWAVDVDQQQLFRVLRALDVLPRGLAGAVALLKDPPFLSQ